MNTIRYTRRQHQHIAWAGPGLYHWNAELDLWVRLTDEELVEWVRNPSGRMGLYLGLDLNNTLEK